MKKNGHLGDWLVAASVAAAIFVPGLVTTQALANGASKPRTAQVAPAKEAPKYFYLKDNRSKLTTPSMLDVRSLGSFTPSLLEKASPLRGREADRLRPRVPGVAGRSAALESGFNFTPSGRASDPRAFAMGVTSRVLKPQADTTVSGLGDAGYNVGVALGYWGFSFEAGFSRVDALDATTKGVDVGLSYRDKDWKTTLQVAGSEQDDSHRLSSLLAADKSYSVELGGAYLLTPRLSVTGGVRYSRLYPGDDANIRANGRNGHDAGQVFLGTEVKF
jgi:hypothetical protein